jgi:hypothetical protein
MKNGFATMGLSKRDRLYEQLILGTKGMACELLREGDDAWLLRLLFVLICVIACECADLEGVMGDR